MRLSPEQIALIRQTAQESFGPSARVWLFGSRVDDSKWGGDIDLFIESDQEDIPIPAQLRAQARLERSLQLPIDLVIQSRSRYPGPIANIARKTGIRLT